MLENPQDVDLLARAESVARLDQKPVIAFDCGVDDQLIEENRALHAHMDKIGLPHTYQEHAGAHTWDYWPHTLPLVSWTASEIEGLAA